MHDDLFAVDNGVARTLRHLAPGDRRRRELAGGMTTSASGGCARWHAPVGLRPRSWRRPVA
jgi:hypothetical protein